MLAPMYEVELIIFNGVMARFICKHYMPVWLRSLTFIHQNWVTWPGYIKFWR